jgi:Rrf2 family protein
MKLSRTATYAVQATMLLAKENSQALVKCRHLAKMGELPSRFLLQILRKLVNHGVLQSVRGIGGGYRLDRPADQISLLEVIEAIDGPLTTESPALASDQFSQARIHDALAGVTKATRAQLDQIKIAHLIPKPPA